MKFWNCGKRLWLEFNFFRSNSLELLNWTSYFVTSISWPENLLLSNLVTFIIISKLEKSCLGVASYQAFLDLMTSSFKKTPGLAKIGHRALFKDFLDRRSALHNNTFTLNFNHSTQPPFIFPLNISHCCYCIYIGKYLNVYWKIGHCFTDYIKMRSIHIKIEPYFTISVMQLYTMYERYRTKSIYFNKLSIK